jgi:uncharacterized membrane protein YfcA
MHDTLIGFLSFCLGTCSGFVGALSSGGGLISIPGLIFLGLPPSQAIATTRLNVISGGLSGFLKYRKEGVVHWNETARFIPLAILGGIIGSKILLEIDERTLEIIVGLLLLTLAPVLIYSKNFGLKNIERSKHRRSFGVLVLLLVTIYSAFFGGGAGTFLVYTFIFFYGMNIIQANANSIFLSIFTALASLLVFLPAGSVNFKYGIPMMIGAAVGSQLGARAAIKKGKEFVKWILLAIIIISAAKLLF